MFAVAPGADADAARLPPALRPRSWRQRVASLSHCDWFATAVGRAGIPRGLRRVAASLALGPLTLEDRQCLPRAPLNFSDPESRGRVGQGTGQTHSAAPASLSLPLPSQGSPSLSANGKQTKKYLWRKQWQECSWPVARRDGVLVRGSSNQRCPLLGGRAPAGSSRSRRHVTRLCLPIYRGSGPLSKKEEEEDGHQNQKGNSKMEKKTPPSC